MAIISRTQWKILTFIYNIIKSRHKLVSVDNNVEFKKYDTECPNSGLLRRKCYCQITPHYDLVKVRCHKYLFCRQCSVYRRNKWYWNCIHRFQSLEPQPEFLKLWTLGSNLHESEINTFKSHWISFRKRMSLYSKRKDFRYEPLFYVYELTKGEGTSPRIHIHMVVDGYLDHQTVLDQWRVSSRFKNVNFAKTKRKYIQPSKAFGYCVKYMTKQFNGQISRGYYLGRLLKAKIDTYSVKYIYDMQTREERKVMTKVVPDEAKSVCSEGEFYKGNQVEVVPIDPRDKFTTGQKTLSDGRMFDLHNPYKKMSKIKRHGVRKLFTPDGRTSSLDGF